LTILSVPKLFPDAWTALTGSLSGESSNASGEQELLEANAGGSPPAGFLDGVLDGALGPFLLPFKGLPPYSKNHRGWRYHYQGLLVGSFLVWLGMYFFGAVFSDDNEKTKVWSISGFCAGGFLLYLLWFIALFPILIFAG
jgi:hypothetical protein